MLLFSNYAFDHFSCDFLADVSSFSLNSGKIRHEASFKLIQPHFMFWYTYWPQMDYQYVDLSTLTVINVLKI